MKHNADQSLASLLVDITTLVPLENNPRKGNIDAIVSSYREFGQLKPIVVRPNADGTATVIAGNHQFQAAKRLGWTHIAAVQYEADDARAIAFALADNRTNELGYTDASALNASIQEISSGYSELLEELGWDIFEMAAISEQAYRIEKSNDDSVGYVPPIIVNPFDNSSKIAVEETEDGTRLVPSSEVDSKKLASTGSTLIGASGIKNAIVQYSLVFDNVEQQTRWYSFIRWLKSDPSIDGETTAERLINFIDAHSDY
jgi:ParB-like chromosome segregation protein Spo0J